MFLVCWPRPCQPDEKWSASVTFQCRRLAIQNQPRRSTRQRCLLLGLAKVMPTTRFAHKSTAKLQLLTDRWRPQHPATQAKRDFSKRVTVAALVAAALDSCHPYLAMFVYFHPITFLKPRREDFAMSCRWLRTCVFLWPEVNLWPHRRWSSRTIRGHMLIWSVRTNNWTIIISRALLHRADDI